MNAPLHEGTSSDGSDRLVAVTVNTRSIAFYTTLDQVLASASNAFLLFVLAQVATVAEFGFIAMIVAVVFALSGFNRGSLGTPILLVSNLPKRDVLIESGYAATWAAGNGLVAAIIVCVVGVAFGDAKITIAFALCVPIVLIQDALRFPAIAAGRPLIAVVADGLWTVAMIGMFVANLVGATPSIEMAIILWGLAGLVSATLLAVLMSVRPRVFLITVWWATYWRSRVRFGLVVASTAASTALTVFAVTTLIGTAAAGGLRGASTLFGPVAMLISALPMVFVPHARRSDASAHDQWRLLLKTCFITSAVTLVCTVLLLFCPDNVGSLVLGESWRPAISVAPYIGLESAANCWMTGVYAWLQTQGRSKALFRLRLLHMAMQLGACVALAATVATASAVAVALAASCWATVVVGVTLVLILIRRPGRPLEIVASLPNPVGSQSI